MQFKNTICATLVLSMAAACSVLGQSTGSRVQTKQGNLTSQAGNIIFESDFSSDTGYQVQSVNLWNGGRSRKIKPPVGWDGVKASHESSISVVSGAGENGKNALKIQWDPNASQPTASLSKHLTGDETTGFDELYIRYNIKLPNNFMVGDNTNGSAYWKWGRLWQNSSPDHSAPNKWTENRANSGYVLWSFSNMPPYITSSATWAEPGGVNLDSGSAGGARHKVDYYSRSGWNPRRSRGAFESLWPIDDGSRPGRLVDNRSQSYHTIEFRFKLASGNGADDGVFEMWWDGVPQGSYRRISHHGGAKKRRGIPTLRINSGWNLFVLFDNLAHWNANWNDPSVDGYVLINDIVISDSYIGTHYRVNQ